MPVILVVMQLLSLTAPIACLAGDKFDKTLQHFEEHKFSPNAPAASNSKTLPYRLLKPEYIKSGRKYPLVIFLHGAGERGTDNQIQLQSLPTLLAQPAYRKKHPCFLVVPQCPTQQSWQQQFPALLEIIDKVMQENPIDKRRIYLTGYSMGAYGTWSLAALRPDLFAAAVPVAGGGDVQTAHQLIDLPIWAIHGNADKAVPVSQSREMIKAIRQAGGSPNYTELKGIGHNCWQQAYTNPNGILPWMFKQKKTWFKFTFENCLIIIMLLIDLIVIIWLFNTWGISRSKKRSEQPAVTHNSSVDKSITEYQSKISINEVNSP